MDNQSKGQLLGALIHVLQAREVGFGGENLKE